MLIDEIAEKKAAEEMDAIGSSTSGTAIISCIAFAKFLLHTISDLASPDRFLRINRSEIVRFDAIRELQPWFHGDCRVVMNDGTTLMGSRRYRGKTKGEM